MKPVEAADPAEKEGLGARLGAMMQASPARRAAALRAGGLLPSVPLDRAPSALARACDDRPWPLRAPLVQAALCGLTVLALCAWRIGQPLARPLRRGAWWASIAAAGAVLCAYAFCAPPASRHYEDIGPAPETVALPQRTTPDAGALARQDADSGASFPPSSTPSGGAVEATYGRTFWRR